MHVQCTNKARWPRKTRPRSAGEDDARCNSTWWGLFIWSRDGMARSVWLEVRRVSISRTVLNLELEDSLSFEDKEVKMYYGSGTGGWCCESHGSRFVFTHQVAALNYVRCVFWRTFLPNVILVRFEKMEALAFLNRSPQQEQQQWQGG